MMTAAHALRDAILQLPEEDRAWLAAEILASLEGPADAGVESAWEEEIDRRVAEIESGAVELLDWQVVKTRFAEKLHKS
jgi:putative addiction module component (TIGR02574 family)